MSYLDKYRCNIDMIDDKIMQLLEERFEIVRKIGEEKKLHKSNVFCANREDQVIKRLTKSSSLDDHFVKILWDHIMDHSKIIQYSS